MDEAQLEALLLSRVQFGLNIGFHILFPTITIGLAWIVAFFRIRYERTRDAAWLRTYKVVGAAIVLPFIFGYRTYSHRVFHGKVRPGIYEH